MTIHAKIATLPVYWLNFKSKYVNGGWSGELVTLRPYSSDLACPEKVFLENDFFKIQCSELWQLKSVVVNILFGQNFKIF